MFEIISIFRILVVISFGFPIFVFGLYGIIVLYYNKIQDTNQQETRTQEYIEYFPYVTVVIPTHNEESIIFKKIENLLNSNYPKDKFEIIFVDDSNDSTPIKIQEYSHKYPFINLIKFNERKGYSPSMIAGCKVAKGEIIVLSDAGSYHDEQTIPNLIRHFKNPEIGAVTGNNIILNIDEEIGKSENLYLKIYNMLRIAETKMNSTFYFKGEASALRKDLIEDLEKCNASFDTAAALSIRKKGYKTIYDPKAQFYEYAPKTHSERVKQKTIRAANLIKILFQFKDMIFNSKYGKFGLIILPMNFIMLVIIPITILTGIFSLTILTYFDFAFSKIAWSIIGIILLTLLIFSKSFLFTFIEFTYSLLKALYQIIFTMKKHDMIETVKSTRR
ncbi:MAG: glycosyltransferase [Candidatus Hodarchaeota archaeon]